MRKFGGIFLATVFALTIASFAGCNAAGFSQEYGAMKWNAVSAAEHYRIYDGDELLATMTEPAYILRLGEGEHTIQVDTYGKNSRKIVSFDYQVPKYTEKRYASASEFEAEHSDGYFSEAQHLVIDYRNGDLTDDYFYDTVKLTSAVKKVSILASKRTAVRVSFLIQRRTSDIEFELENIDLRGNYSEPSTIGYSENGESTGTLVIKMFGAYNTISCGYSAPSGESGEPDGWFKHGGTGGTGGKGGNAVSAGALYIVSEGDASFTGGDGGSGGNGGNASGINCVGSGGNGGAGGAAIACDTVKLFMLDGSLSCAGGAGGSGGSKGYRTDGKPFAGDANRTDGIRGADGAGISATTKKAVRGEF